MLERIRRSVRGTDATSDGAVAADGPPTTTREAPEPVTREMPAPATREMLAGVRARQREEFGGINWGAAFFGWLVAVGVAALLTAWLAAAGAEIGLTETSATDDEDRLTWAGAIVLLAALMVAYLCGGYVAGRMSRFDGARQGLGAWLVGLVITLAIAMVALAAGPEYNAVEQANLPRLPVGEEEMTTGGWLATLAIVAGTLAASVLGGIAGLRYHRRVDRSGLPH